MHFYGIRDATESPQIVEELATIGIKQVGFDYVVGAFGSPNSGRVAINARSKSTAATIESTNYSTGPSGNFLSTYTGSSYPSVSISGSGSGTGGPALLVMNDAIASGAIGARIWCTENGYGIYCDDSAYGTELSPLKLGVSTSSSAPSHTAATGSLWVTSAGVLYIYTTNSPAWQKVGAQ